MAKRVGMSDLVRASREVPIGDDTEVEVFAISILSFVNLVKQFPVVGRMMTGGLKTGEFSLEALMEGAPGFIAEFIVAGSATPGNADLLETIKGLSVGMQLALAEGVLNATLEGGMSPFVARLNRLLEAAGGDPLAATDSATKE